MNEIDDSEDNRLTLKAPSKLELKKTVGSGQVRQSFSRGRTKPVTVEVKKKRTISREPPPALSDLVKNEESLAAIEASPKEPEKKPEVEKSSRPRGVVLKSLTEDEKAARARALDGARQRDEDARRVAAEEEENKLQEEERLAKEHKEAELRKSLEEERKKGEEQVRLKAERTAAKKLVESDSFEEQKDAQKKGSRENQRRSPGGRRQASDRRGKRFNINEALSGEERVRSLASVRRARERERKAASVTLDVPKKVFRDVVVPELISVQELANRMTERSVDVIKTLMRMGVMVTPNSDLDADTAQLIVEEFGHRVKRVSESDIETEVDSQEDDAQSLQPRPPVVTIMGHVDHGKTSLLDSLRETDIASSEAGGITQHIGAYQVTTRAGHKITFLDTPGHEAFTAMRSRGANITDIVVLVVAADDGLMPQTIEAIRHAKEAEVPIIVAVNKIDLTGANPRKVREELLQHELVVEEMGGDILAIDVSAKEKINLDKLEEAILLQAELLELKANPNRTAEGIVIEAKIDTGRGPVATVLVKRGTLKVGQVFVAGGEWGRVRAMVDVHGSKLSDAGPAVPVEVLGLTGAPAAGDMFLVVDNESKAREIALYRQRKGRVLKAGGTEKSTMEEMFAQIQKGEMAEFPIVLKADVQGSVEAIANSVVKLNNEEVGVRVVHSAVGGINESDVGLARSSSALIVGFNVRANAQARDLANREKVDIRYYSVIYDLIEEIKNSLTSMLAPKIKEHALGNSEILEIFSVSKAGKIAGCRVLDGVIKRGARVRLLRDNVVIHQGALSNLKRFKDDVDEVKAGMECGMALEKYQDIQPGDVIEAYEVEEIARTL